MAILEKPGMVDEADCHPVGCSGIQKPGKSNFQNQRIWCRLRPDLQQDLGGLLHDLILGVIVQKHSSDDQGKRDSCAS